MNGRDLSQQMFCLALFVLLLTGCVVAQAEPTATPVPPAATSAPLACDYVVLGDSIACGLSQLYATHLEADLGVEVRMHIWCAGDQSSSELLSALRDNQELRSDLREAEVVTFHVSTRHLKEPVHAYRRGTCGGPDNQDCLREALTLLKANTDAIVAEILSLCSTSDTIIRAMTFYNFVVNDLKEGDYFKAVNPFWVAHNDYLVQVVTEHDIPVARADLAFNGPNLDVDPSDKGYLSDGVHPNPEGYALLAELFRELGYEPLASR